MGQSPMQRRQRRLLGIDPHGKLFYSICGAEPNDDDDDDQDGSADGGTGSGGGDGGNNGDGNNDGGSGGSGDAENRIYTKAEMDQVLRRLSAADRNRTAAEQKIKEYEDANKSEAEKAQAELKEAKERAAKAEQDLLKMRIHNKFLSSNKYTWHDPETALALLDLADVNVNEDGGVDGLNEAIEALAKSKPFLLKTDGSDDKGKSNKQSQGNGKPSGNQPPANGSNGQRATDREKLLKKYPQLSR